MEEKILKTAQIESLCQELEQHLKANGPLMVAYSGGIDSALLAVVAHRALKNDMLAVIADSPSLARREYRLAIEFSQKMGFPLKVVRTAEFNKQGYLDNAGDRCYYCKQSLFEKLGDLQQELEPTHWKIAYGVNTNDLGDYRPGLQAAKEAKVFSPYLDLNISKESIRRIAQYLNLDISEKPAMPCLSSRIPHGSEVTLEKLQQVEKAEDHLFDLGFQIFRVRHHDQVARIEVRPEDFEKLLQHREDILTTFRDLGYYHIAMDLHGFQSGSLNKGLDLAN